MAVSPALSSLARTAAFEILLRVEREESYAAELLHSARLAKLSSRDHGLATELVMGVLRWQSLLDQRLAGASAQKIERLDSEVLAALRLGIYQLQFLSRVPVRVAIFESVALVKAARKRRPTSTWSLRTRVIYPSRLPLTSSSPTFLAPAPALWPATPKSSGGLTSKTCTIFSRGRWPF